MKSYLILNISYTLFARFLRPSSAELADFTAGRFFAKGWVRHGDAISPEIWEIPARQRIPVNHRRSLMRFREIRGARGVSRLSRRRDFFRFISIFGAQPRPAIGIINGGTEISEVVSSLKFNEDARSRRRVAFDGFLPVKARTCRVLLQLFRCPDCIWLSSTGFRGAVHTDTDHKSCSAKRPHVATWLDRGDIATRVSSSCLS